MLAALMSSLASAFQLLLDAAHVGTCTASSGPTRASSGWWRWDGSTTVLLVGLGSLVDSVHEVHLAADLHLSAEWCRRTSHRPIAACFLLGVLFPRLNGTGALAALWTGLVLGTARLVLELARASLASGSMWYWFATINFLHFAALLFVLCSGILIAVSLATAPPGAARTAGLTVGHRRSRRSRSRRPAELEHRPLDCLAATIGVLWIVFR